MCESLKPDVLCYSHGLRVSNHKVSPYFRIGQQQQNETDEQQKAELEHLLSHHVIPRIIKRKSALSIKRDEVKVGVVTKVDAFCHSVK